MRYFKNTELAKIYSVSEKTVRNWIQAANDKKLALQLHQENGKFLVANTAKNTLLIEELVAKNKKYKNSRGFKVANPLPAFYKTFTQEQIFDIISSLENHREMPHKYGYFGKGAKQWDDYSWKMAEGEFPNPLTNTIDLLGLSGSYIDELTDGYDAVNIIDIGVGNGLPVKDLITRLLDKGQMGRYIGIDTSQDMLTIAEANIRKWFGDKVAVESYIKDAAYDRFRELTIADTFSRDDHCCLNLVLFLGGTIATQREPDLALRTIASSMGKDDLFIMTRKLDTPAARRFFDFDVDTKFGVLEKERGVLALLGIDDSYYAMEQLFEEEKQRRVIQAKFKFDTAITFEIDGKRKVIEVKKDEAVSVWYANHQKLTDVIEQFGETGFEVVLAAKSKDQQHAEVVAKIKTQA